ncbi:hypothetical protein DPMN_074904 [Dreissena polymorpha]|uniref:E2 domain-containing protein n=1 Tax=Dreissena polymorpha TaxID=45954 RepID=A0A9D3YKP9_DREPO|nr:hypothetical protein DPMN_074904 [Dreissena polymorpha]
MHDLLQMMKEWQEARDNLAEMMKTDKKGAESLNKEITEVTMVTIARCGEKA